jgi:hypothetical protein
VVGAASRQGAHGNCACQLGVSVIKIMVMSDTTQAERDAKTGRFLTGNIGGGRSRGSRNKLAEAFVEDLHACWEEHGASVLVRVARDEPAALLRTIAMLMPKDLNLSIGISPETFVQTFRSAQALLGNPEPAPRRRLPNQKVIEHGS